MNPNLPEYLKKEFEVFQQQVIYDSRECLYTDHWLKTTTYVIARNKFNNQINKKGTCNYLDYDI